VRRNKRRHFPLAILAILAFLASSARSLAAPANGPFSIVSDIHFNPFFDPSLVANLVSAPANRWEPILNRSHATSYSPYGQDTNWPLLQSALDAVRTTEPHPALLMITGDLLAHGFPRAYAGATHDTDPVHYRAFVLKTVTFLAWELRRRFPKTQILLTPGNNDDECGDYQIQADGPFLNDTAALARALARGSGSFIADWKALGSYAVRPTNVRGVRIVSVNSVFFSNKYQAANFAGGCSQVDSTAASSTFTWLEAALSQARQANEKVWIMFHIPPGIDGFSSMLQYRRLQAGGAIADLCSKAIVPMWKPEWTARFEGILHDYQSTVTATFAGHDHTDDFRVLRANEPGEAFVLIDPPVSPIYGQNPAFRVVSFTEGGRLANQSTYYLTNLTSAGSGVPGNWTREYSFAEEWQREQLDSASLKSVYDRIRSDAAVRARWLNILNVSSSRDTVPAQGVGNLDCAIEALDPATYKNCYCPIPSP
jgi:sphingomyelin phosphodiesterase acid-like 3